MVMHADGAKKKLKIGLTLSFLKKIFVMFRFHVIKTADCFTVKR